MKWHVSKLLAAGAVCGFAHAASAQSYWIDLQGDINHLGFGGQTDPVLETDDIGGGTWNAFEVQSIDLAGVSSFSTGPISLPLVDSTGAASGVTFQVGSAANDITGWAGAAGADALQGDYLIQFEDTFGDANFGLINPSSVLDFSITGLTANTSYDLTFFHGANNDDRGLDFVANGVAASVTGATMQTSTISVTTNGAGSIIGTSTLLAGADEGNWSGLVIGDLPAEPPPPPPIPDLGLIANGAFEINADGVEGRAGIGAPNPTNVELPASLQDWTVDGQILRWPDGTSLFGGVDIGDSGDAGEVVVNFGNLGSITQSITTVIGEEYQITYDLGALGGAFSPDPDGFVADIDVLVDGVVVDTQSVSQDADGTNLDWTTYTVNFTATGTTTEIKFEETDDVAGDDYGAILDNVGVFLVGFAPADLDQDGDVDDADFALFFAAFSGPGVPTGNPAADLDGDTDTDDADFGLAFAAFTGPGGAAANVPEPASLALLGLGGLLAMRRRRA